MQKIVNFIIQNPDIFSQTNMMSNQTKRLSLDTSTHS